MNVAQSAGGRDREPAAGRVVVAGGSGLIGRALVAGLARDGVPVTVLSRTPRRASARLPGGVAVAAWDPADPARRSELAASLDGAAAVVNVSGIPVGPRPWTPGRRRAIVSSRVGTNAALVAAIAGLELDRRPRTLVSAAGIEGYTGMDAAPVDETAEIGGAGGFLAELGRDWEAAALAAEPLGLRVVLVRTSFVLARGSTLMQLLALPVRLGAGGRFGSGRQWFSWIHLDDLVAVYRRAIDDPALAGAVIAASPAPCSQADLVAAMARILHRPNWFPTPAWLLRLILRGQAPLLLGSRRLDPGRLRAVGFGYRYPDLDAALHEVLGRSADRA